jgi:hypothetical protein
LKDDPLADLELTTNGFCRVIEWVRGLGKPWVALGGGGYDVHNVARAWTLAWAGMNEVDLPDDLPDSMRGRVRAGMKGGGLRDPGHRSLRHESCARYMDRCLLSLCRSVPALTGL